MNVVVTGPESSGTRFVSRWLEAHPDVVARHWSMPSGEKWMRHWPTDHDFDGEMPDAIVFVIRAHLATGESQLARKMVDTWDEVDANIAQAHLRSFAWAVSHGIKILPLSYDTIVDHPERFDAVFGWLNLEPVPCPEMVVDTNAKWFA